MKRGMTSAAGCLDFIISRLGLGLFGLAGRGMIFG